MDVPWWSLVSVILAAFLGAGVNHVLGRRAESLQALREARTSWAIRAMEHRREVVRTVVDDESELVVVPELEIDSTLRVLDPRGAAIAWTMVHVQTEAERRMSKEWRGGNELVATVVPPQIERIGNQLEMTIALWSRASWRMPIWLMATLCRWQLWQEQLWTNYTHHELSYREERRQRRADAKRFRDYARKLRLGADEN